MRTPEEIFADLETSASFTIKDGAKIVDGKTKKYFIISWAEKGRGFGEYVFWKDGDKMIIDNECDSRESIKRVMCNLIDNCELADEKHNNREVTKG